MAHHIKQLACRYGNGTFFLNIELVQQNLQGYFGIGAFQQQTAAACLDKGVTENGFGGFACHDIADVGERFKEVLFADVEFHK